MQSLGRDMVNNNITLNEADRKHKELLKEILTFNNKVKPRDDIEREQKSKYF